MIASLTGTVEDFTETGVVLNVGGIGFEVLTGSETMQILSGKGREEPVHLYTSLNVGREGEMTLYGFLSRAELRLFRLLITVSGIGPKGALSLLSAMSADDLIFAILSGDSKSISRAPGVGKKTAERLVLDLRDRLSRETAAEQGGGYGGMAAALAGSAGQDGGSGPGSGGAGDENRSASDRAAEEAAEALAALGYTRMEAVKAVKQARAELESGEGPAAADTEALLRAALKHMV